MKTRLLIIASILPFIIIGGLIGFYHKEIIQTIFPDRDTVYSSRVYGNTVIMDTAISVGGTLYMTGEVITRPMPKPISDSAILAYKGDTVFVKMDQEGITIFFEK